MPLTHEKRAALPMSGPSQPTGRMNHERSKFDSIVSGTPRSDSDSDWGWALLLAFEFDARCLSVTAVSR